MRITLSGHPWHVYSPSHYQLASHSIGLHYRGAGLPSRSLGEGWYLSFEGNLDGARPWPSRDAGAAAIAGAFVAHQMQEHRVL